MIKRQIRILWIRAVAEEYQAAVSAATLLGEKLKGDPNYGDKYGWRQRAGQDFADNLEATYLVRMYAEFEAALRDYWTTYRKKDTHPPMVQLLNHSIPDQRFPQDFVDRADEVREYRNCLVHDEQEEPPATMVTFTVEQARSHLCAYLACLDPNWK
jgi:hypothetical protein